MKTRALLLALPLVVLAGCRDNRASVQIQMMCAPTASCTFTATCDAQYIGFATVDAAQTGHLWLVIQVENQLPDNSNKDTGRLNTNDAHVDQVTIDYDGGPLGSQTYDVGSYRVPAAGTSVVSVEVIPMAATAQTALAAFAPTATPRAFTANIRLRGYLDDGTRFETGQYPVNVHVCTGCVGVCPAGGTGTCPPNSDGQLPLTCMK